VQWRGEQREERHAALGDVRILAEPERGGKRRERELVDAEGPHQRVLHDFRNEGRLADDDAALWTTEELVATEQDEIRAGFDAVAGDWLASDAVFLQI